MFIQGMFGSQKFAFLEVKVLPCITPNDPSQKWNPTCAPQSEVDAITLRDGFHGMNIYHSNYVLNADQPENFFTPYINDKLYFTFVPYQMTQLCDIYFQDIQVINDQSLLPNEDNIHYQFLTQENNDVRETTQLSRKDGVFVVLTLRLSPYVTTISRSYKKVSQLMSELGGFVQIVLACIGLVMRRYNNFKFTVDLANNLYQFDLKQDSTQKKNNPKTEPQSSNEIMIQQPLSSSRPIIQGADLSYSHRKKHIANQKLEEQTVMNNNQILANNQSQILSFNNIQSENGILNKSEQLPTPKSQFIEFSNLQSNNTKEKIKTAVKRIKDKDQIFKNYCAGEKEYQCKVLQEKLDQQSYLMKQFKNIISQQKKLTVGFKYFVSKFSWSKFFNSEYNQYITKATKMIHSDLDICNILDKIQQIEKIKNIIFDEDQQTVFNYYPKPLVKLDNINIHHHIQNQQINPPQQHVQQSTSPMSKEDLTSQHNKGILCEKNEFQSVESYKKLFGCYISLKNENDIQNHQLNVNQRLINFLGQDLLNIFKYSELIENHNGKFDHLASTNRIVDQSHSNRQQFNANNKMVQSILKKSNNQSSNQHLYLHNQQNFLTDRTHKSEPNQQINQKDTPPLQYSNQKLKSINITFDNNIVASFKLKEPTTSKQQFQLNKSATDINNNQNQNSNEDILTNSVDSSKQQDIPSENDQSQKVSQCLKQYINE